MELEVTQPDGQPGTEVRSNFVANYPPFSAWSADDIPAVHEALDMPVTAAALNTPHSAEAFIAARGPTGVRSGASPRGLGLYMHIPFCRKRCKFCFYRVYTDKNASDVETYLDGLVREIAMYKERSALAGREFEFVYFGGGTPSFLSKEQLLRLVERINEHWRWDAAREVTFECEPGTLRQSKLEAIRQIGVTRLSLGIEHFDDEILEANGRAHKSPEIMRAYAWAREVGFPQINVDLIAGMAGETDAKWAAAVEQTLALQPDSLTIYQMELPPNAVFSRQVRETGQSPIASWERKRKWVADAFARFEAAGYVASSGYTLVKPADESAFVYRDSLWHGADLLGAGVSAFGTISGVHAQNHAQWGDYLAALGEGALPLARAIRTTETQRMIRELVLQMKLGRIDAAYFQAKFGVDIRARFAEQLRSLQQRGTATIEDGRVTLTRAGLLMVDELLPQFFESQFREPANA